MKTLMLLRHAKSSWNQPHLLDSLRPLAPRGRKAAQRVGAYMASNGLVPERVYCSSARRAVETWRLVAEHLTDSIQVEISDGLYQASPGDLLAMLHGLPATVDRILMVGHNPTLEELASSLAGDGREESLDVLDRKYPTGALAVFEFPVESWSGVRNGTGYLRDLVLPRRL